MPKKNIAENEQMDNDYRYEEAERKHKEQEEQYQKNVKLQVEQTKKRNEQFENRRYTRKAELAQLVAAWRKELEADPEVLKDEALEKILRDVEEYVKLDVTATHASMMNEEKDSDRGFLAAKSGVKKESRKVAEIFEDVKNYIQKIEEKEDVRKSIDEEELLKKRQIMAQNIHLFLEDQVTGFLPPVPQGARHIKAKDNISTGFFLDGLWDYRDRPLFPHDPSPSDVRQGVTGDCYMVALLANVARKNPDIIKESIRDNGDGTVTVRLFQRIPPSTYPPSEKEQDRMEPYYVTVDKTAPIGMGSHNSLWVAMIEKAVVASGLAIDKEIRRTYTRPVPENIDEIYEKYKDMPDYLRPSKVDCPWLYNKNNEFVKWSPKYEDIEGGKSEEFGEIFLGPGYDGISEDLENVREDAGRDIAYNYMMKLLEQASSKEFANRIKDVLDKPENSKGKLENAARVLRAVNNKSIDYTSYQLKLSPVGLLEDLGSVKGDKGYQEFARILSSEISEMLFECNLSQKSTEDILEHMENKITERLQANMEVKKFSDDDKLPVNNLLQDLKNNRQMIAEEISGGNYPASYLKKYEEIKQELENGTIIGVGSPYAPQGDSKFTGGINYQHAYNVMGVTEEKIGDKTYKFIYIRNPHGRSLVPKYDFNSIPPRVKDDYDVHAEGIFKMELSHFMNNMDDIDYNGKVLSEKEKTSKMTARTRAIEELRKGRYAQLISIINKDLTKALKKEKFDEGRLQTLKENLKLLIGGPEKDPDFSKYKEVRKTAVEILEKEQPKSVTARILKSSIKILELYENNIVDPIAEIGQDISVSTLPTNRTLYDFIDIEEQNEFSAGIKVSEGEAAKLLKMLQDVDPFTVSSSTQFKQMMGKAKEFSQSFKDLKTEPTEDKMEAYIQSLKKLGEASKEYLNFKTEQRTQKDGSIIYKSDRERKRMNAAEKIIEYAASKSQKLEKSFVEMSLALKLQKKMFPEQKIDIRDFRINHTVRSKEFKSLIEGKNTQDLRQILKDEHQIEQLTSQYQEKRESSIDRYIEDTQKEYEHVFNNGLSTREEKIETAARYIYGNILWHMDEKELAQCTERAVRSREQFFVDLIKKEEKFQPFLEKIDSQWASLGNERNALKAIEKDFIKNLSKDKQTNMETILKEETKEIAKKDAQIQKEEKNVSKDIKVEVNEIDLEESGLVK